MKITIDTSHDSEEDIRKVIALLQGLSGKPQVSEEVDYEEKVQPATPGFMNIFDNAESSVAKGPSVEHEESEEQESTEEPELSTDTVRIVPY